MKKRMFSLVLAVMAILCLTAHAAQPRVSVNHPELTISGTTATCKVDYSAPKTTDTVKVTLALWCGDNIVDSWTETGKGTVSMKETCKVVKGNTYDLVMMPVVNGVAKSTVTVSADS